MGKIDKSQLICLILGVALLVLSVIGFITASKVVGAYGRNENWHFTVMDKSGQPLPRTADMILSQAAQTFKDGGAYVLGMDSFSLFLARARIWIGVPALLLILIGVIGIVRSGKNKGGYEQ